MPHRSGRIAWGDRQGTTLMELMMALAIFGMIMSAIFLLWQKTQESYFQGSEAAELQGNVRIALDQMVRELRRTGHSPTTPLPFTPIQTASATTLEIRTDLNDDGDTSDANEHVTFAFDAANSRLTRDDGGGAQLLAEHIIPNPDGTPIFQYWQRPLSGTQCGPEALVLAATPTLQCIRRLTITLTGQTTMPGQQPVNATVRTDVDLRPL